jgi:hypothetical protein
MVLHQLWWSCKFDQRRHNSAQIRVQPMVFLDGRSRLSCHPGHLGAMYVFPNVRLRCDHISARLVDRVGVCMQPICQK